MENKKENYSGILNSDQVRLLSSVGFMAARTGFYSQATYIFESLIENRPDMAFGFVGLALSNLCIGSSTGAVNILEGRALAQVKDVEEIKAWLAISLWFSGETRKAFNLANQLENEDVDPATKALIERIFFSVA